MTSPALISTVPWERRLDESEDEFLSFIRFLSLGRGRTLDQVAGDDADEAKTHEIKRLAATYEWFSRVEEWDRTLTKNEMSIQQDRQREILEQMWLDGLKLRKQGLNILAALAKTGKSSIKEVEKVGKKTVTTELSVRDAMNMMKEGAILQARACALDEQQEDKTIPPTQINFLLQPDAPQRMKHVEIGVSEGGEVVLPHLPDPEKTDG